MCMTNILGVCIVAAQLTHLDTSTNAQLHEKAYSYDGVERNISKFYKQTDRRYEIGGDIYTKDMRISFDYDNGLKTDKLSIGDSFGIGVNKYIPLDNNFSINIGGSYRWNGKVSDTPCLDDEDREYYCATATAWSDHDTFKVEDEYTMGIKFNFKF